MYKMELRLYGSRQLIEGQRGGGHQLIDLYVNMNFLIDKKLGFFACFRKMSGRPYALQSEP